MKKGILFQNKNGKPKRYGFSWIYSYKGFLDEAAKIYEIRKTHKRKSNEMLSNPSVWINKSYQQLWEISLTISRVSSKVMTPSELLKLFASETSCHGIGKLISGKPVGIRVFWGFVILSALVGLCAVLKSIIEGFLDWPTATSITIHSKPALSFPSVVFCSSNLFNRYLLQNQNISEQIADYSRLTYSTAYERFDPISMNKTLSEEYDVLVKRYGSIFSWNSVTSVKNFSPK